MEKGIVVALITPLTEDENIDIPSLGGLLEWVLSHDIKGLFVAGTIGEGPALRDRQRYTLFCETVKYTKGRVPVLANVSDMSTQRVIDQVKLAVKAGADAVVTTPRFGFPPRTSCESFRHVKAIASYSSVPVWFYENPSTTPVTNSFQTICQILDLENVTGLKYSGPSREVFKTFVTELAESVPVMTGNVFDITYAASIGATGAISGIGSLAPGLCIKAFETGRTGTPEEAQKIQDAIESLYSIYGGKGWPLWPTAQKHVLMKRGIIKTNFSTAPFLRLTAEEETKIDLAMENIDPELSS
ncbi:MAG: dihydrodipicolinate synthase family protein [Planctomycetota bacterium]